MGPTFPQKIFLCCVGVLLITFATIGMLHQPKHAKLKFTTEYYSAVDVDLLFHDLEVARQQAREAYRRVTASDQRVLFDAKSLTKHD